MAFLLLAVQTEVKWIKDMSKTPILGSIFLFVLTFIPAVLASFLIDSIVPALNNDIGFTKSMLVILPAWNLFLWFTKVRLYLLFLPSWMLLGGIAIVKGILLITGIDDGQ